MIICGTRHVEFPDGDEKQKAQDKRYEIEHHNPSFQLGLTFNAGREGGHNIAVWQGEKYQRIPLSFVGRWQRLMSVFVLRSGEE